jgi:hypothetical protein
MMTQNSLRRPIGKGIIFGAIGGFVGGVLMYAIMTGVMEAIGMGANCFAVILALITGQPFSNSLVPIGLAIHLITSTVIGAIFGVVISSINKLRINGFVRGIGFGVAAGLIAFVIMFLPIAMIAMPPKMLDLMKMMPMGGSGSSSQMMSGNSNGNGKPAGIMMKTGGDSSSSDISSSNTGMSEKSQMSKITTGMGMNEKSTTAAMSGGMKSEMNNDQMMMEKELPKMQLMIIAGSLLSHVVYGAVLGSVVTILLVKTARTIATTK